MTVRPDIRDMTTFAIEQEMKDLLGRDRSHEEEQRFQLLLLVRTNRLVNLPPRVQRTPYLGDQAIGRTF